MDKTESCASRKMNPSFSSSLLEAVYRSIDESEGRDLSSSFHHEGFAAAGRKQISYRDYDHNAASAPSSAGRRRLSSIERVVMIEEWMQKQGAVGRGSSSLRLDLGSSLYSSSSDRRRGTCSFSFNETESGHRKYLSEQKSRATDFGDHKKTKQKVMNEDFGGGFSRMKLGDLKVYRELQKVKQPISPSRKISAFLNSIFNSGKVKKVHMCYVGTVDDVISFDQKATLPLLSKTPSSRKLSTNAGSNKPPKTKRIIKLCPSRFTSGDNSAPCLYRTVSRSHSSYKQKPFASTTNNVGDRLDVNEDSKTSSCLNSDLFERDNHLIERYREKRNEAIARGYFTM
ncbi:hypothetical protein MLD38_005843 [Melastoma candidum]|uniref:Uncharacterized protein n=1 Tax=Melastoma candidum TaxID=119954 RepID=A0ACB9RQ55_9MYRT|nr:hypothetical protein MLD38_005843 [Melastoma candidum]